MIELLLMKKVRSRIVLCIVVLLLAPFVIAQKGPFEVKPMDVTVLWAREADLHGNLQFSNNGQTQGEKPYYWVQGWNSLDDYLDLGNRVANAGFPVVLCNVDNFYLDLAYTHHPDEPGHYWGGFVNTRRAFEFIPFHVFHSTITNKYRIPYGEVKSFE